MAKNTEKSEIKFKMADFLGLGHGTKRLFFVLGCHMSTKFRTSR